ncbi:MAG: membrane protein of unknown function [Candidatus Thorarchaeota archaeon]|nr:MAG: membrane protein of unknown function [Candidatus Thorarchaeota archaeon]
MASINKRSLVVLLLLTTIGFILSMLWAFFGSDFSDITPLFGLPTPLHFLVVAFVIPMLGGIITGIVFPRLITPLFLRLVGLKMRKYKTAYLPVHHDRLGIRRWFGRAVLTALLILGLMAAVINIIDPQILMTPTNYADLLAETGLPQYTPPVTISIAGFLSPLAFGLWAVSWALEDAGILQYYLPEKDGVLYDIEPIHHQYSGYLKGYAGLSSVIFFVSIFLLFAGQEGLVEVAVFTLLIPLFLILQTIPGYIVYTRMSNDYLRKGLQQAGPLTESDLGISNQ